MRLFEGERDFRLDILEPEVRILVVKDGKYLLYQPRIRQAISGKVEGQGTKGLFPGLLTGSPESFRELEESYSSSDLGESALGERRVHHISFRAKPGAPVYCQEIHLFVDAAPVFFRDGQSATGVDGQEIEANAFAAELLMPESILRDLVGRQPIDVFDDAAVRRLASRFEVSPQALTIRLSRLGLVTV